MIFLKKCPKIIWKATPCGSFGFRLSSLLEFLQLLRFREAFPALRVSRDLARLRNSQRVNEWLWVQKAGYGMITLTCSNPFGKKVWTFNFLAVLRNQKVPKFVFGQVITFIVDLMFTIKTIYWWHPCLPTTKIEMFLAVSPRGKACFFTAKKVFLLRKKWWIWLFQAGGLLSHARFHLCSLTEQLLKLLEDGSKAPSGDRSSWFGYGPLAQKRKPYTKNCS